MKCQSCGGSSRILSVSSHSKDMCVVSINDIEEVGYTPYDMGIGGGDDVEIDLCLNCGLVQGKWPLPLTKLEKKIDDDC